MATPAELTAERIEHMLDQAEPRMRQALLNAVTAARDANTLAQLEALILSGRFDEAVEAAALAGAVRAAEGYAAVFVAAGAETARFLTDALEVTIGFNQVNERAVERMRRERLALIREFTDGQRRATRMALTEGIERGLNPREQAVNFRNSIGLTERQQAAVANYRRLLERGSAEALSRRLRDRRFDRTVRRAVEDGRILEPEQIDRMVDRYRERYIRYRSETIARTEALRAVHGGSREAFLQAIDDGYLEEDRLKRKWVTARDERVRSSHIRLNGLVRAMGETFPGDDGPLLYPGDPNAPGSETINCRCVLTTRID